MAFQLIRTSRNVCASSTDAEASAEKNFPKEIDLLAAFHGTQVI
jgi:hypothetical protein